MFTDITTPIITSQPIFYYYYILYSITKKGFSIVFINKIRKVMHVGY